MSISHSLNQMLQSAQEAFTKKDYPRAVAIFQQILESIDAAQQPVAHAEARNNLSVALLKSGRFSEAYEQALGTDSVFAQNGDILKQAMALGNTAAALAELHRYDEALEIYQQASELFKQAGDEDTRSYVLSEISALQIRRGKGIESMFAMDRALNSREKLTLSQRFLKGVMKIFYWVTKPR